MPRFLTAIDIIEDSELSWNPSGPTRKQLNEQPTQTVEERQLKVRRETDRINALKTRWAREDMELFPNSEDD